MTPHAGASGTMAPLEDDATRDTADLGSAAVEQFQRAALDAVKAARALLDAAESVIQEPAAIEAMVKTVSSVAKSASDVVAGFASGAGAPSSAPDDAGSDGFEHIRVD